MMLTKTARQKLRNNTRYYGCTLILYCVALEYVSRIVLAEWVNIANLPDDKARNNFIEMLVHTASGSAAVNAELCRRTKALPVRQDISRHWFRSLALRGLSPTETLLRLCPIQDAPFPQENYHHNCNSSLMVGGYNNLLDEAKRALSVRKKRGEL
jgi:hypothetical protein